ncbi:hypothetical protein C8J56DRAFT_898914 [Mycena floridula]|nr:hypothetical protein C8J56DRAFT_898914 [Mycena floridula]
MNPMQSPQVLPKAKEFMDCLPHKWDPRAQHPEDNKELVGGRGDDPNSFDRQSMICKGNLKEAFRIFTEGDPMAAPPFNLKEIEWRICTSLQGNKSKENEEHLKNLPEENREKRDNPNVDLSRYAAEEPSGSLPSNRQIWKATRHPD